MDSFIIKKITQIEPISFAAMTDWMYHWWGKAEGYSIEEVECCMAHSLNDVRLPQTYGLFAGDTLIGMYQFTYCDLDIRPDIYPWLANLYIRPDHRGCGLSIPLIDSALKNAGSIGFKELYLYTEHVGLYEKFGFKFLEMLDTYKKTPRFQRLYRKTL